MDGITNAMVRIELEGIQLQCRKMIAARADDRQAAVDRALKPAIKNVDVQNAVTQVGDREINGLVGDAIRRVFWKSEIKDEIASRIADALLRPAPEPGA